MAAPALVPAVSSMGLTSLQHEPQRLAAEAERTNLELESLVLDNYKIFVENLTCSVNLKSEDKVICGISSKLASELSGLMQCCAGLKENVVTFVESHKRNRKTLQNHDQLVDLLDIPHLVDACSRNGFFDEALELANFVNGLEKRHLMAAEVRNSDGSIRAGSSVIRTIVADVQRTLTSLRSQLVRLLSETVSLPRELQLLATLRKLDGLLIERQLSVEKNANAELSGLSSSQKDNFRSQLMSFAENRLQMDFLEARSIWLRRETDKATSGQRSGVGGASFSSLGEGESESGTASSSVAMGPYGRTIELLETCRSSWFAIATHFKALFEEKEQPMSSSQSNYPASLVLSAWLSAQVGSLLAELQEQLPLIEEGTSLRTIFEQSLYFASRMGEVGCDFSGLLIPLFADLVASRCRDSLNNVSVYFESMVSNEKFVVEVDDAYREQIVPLFMALDNTTGQGASISTKSGKVPELTAPNDVMSYPPLAYFFNGVISVLNFVRDCPMRCIGNQVLFELSECLHKTVRYLTKHCKDIQSRGQKYLNGGKVGRAPMGFTLATQNGNGETDQQDMSKRYAVCLCEEVAPHLLQCLDCVFQLNPNKETMVLPLTKLQMAKRFLSQSSFHVLESVWRCCQESGLIPKEISAVVATERRAVELMAKREEKGDGDEA